LAIKVGLDKLCDGHFLETLELIAMANNDDQLIRPTFPNQNTLGNEEAYSLQLLSAIEACWLEIPEVYPSSNQLEIGLLNT
jgi:hypothetical protein